MTDFWEQGRAALIRDIAMAALTERAHDMALVIDRARRVIERNEASEGRDGRSLPFRTGTAGPLEFVDPDAERWVGAILADPVLQEAFGPEGRIFREGRMLYRIAIHRIALPARAQDLGIGDLFLVLVRDLRTGHAVIDAAVVQTWQLTPSETRVCQSLVEGLSLTEIAEHHRLTRETVRTMLKRIFSKTGTSRQAELVALLIRMG